MELKIISKKEEPLLSRIKIDLEVAFDKATPSKAEIHENLANMLGKDKSMLIVKGIYNYYGSRKAKSFACLYENKEVLERIENIKKVGKEKKKKETPSKQQEDKK